MSTLLPANLLPKPRVMDVINERKSPFKYFFEGMKIFMISAFLIATSSLLAQNAIVTENAKPGSLPSEWEISGKGDPTIQGFATDISVNKGERIKFKINTDAGNYSIKIYRIGYYQGNGARKVGDGVVTATLPQTQPDDLYDLATGMTDCSNWNESGYYDVPSNAVSGIYLARLTRLDNGGSSHIVFIVRDDVGSSNLLFKTSDATWQAYNDYGGSNLYSSNIPILGTIHATKVSYNRPFNTADGGLGSAGTGAEDWFLNAEYPMIRFLERNGYDLSYTTDVDMDRSSTPITPAKHKVLLSVGHDEYWSPEMRKKFEDARNAGVHLAFFSGNEIYWKTRWEDNRRTLVCYKEGTLGENVCGGKCDPSNEWTGLWRSGCNYPGKGGCLPENALSGQISWNLGTGAIEVPAAYKNLRFWRNTSIANLNDGETATLSAGTLGFEFDWEQYPESYPGGRITMSNTTLNSRTHKLSLYRHSSGALVFAAGTVQWSWGLDETHDRGTSIPDVRMQQATVNLFADMGVQPATLQNGLIKATASTDNIPPKSVITSPELNFSFKDGSSITIIGTASDVGGVVAGVEVSIDGGQTWTMAKGTTSWSITLPFKKLGEVIIKSRSFDDSGNIEDVTNSTSPNIKLGKVIPKECPCSVFNSTDAPEIELNEGQPLEVGFKFRTSKNGVVKSIRYYKGEGTSGTHLGHLWNSSGVMLAEATFTNEGASGWQEVSFTTPVSVIPGVTYTASVHSSSGDFASTLPYFTDPIIQGPLIALADGADGGNGVFIYSPTPAFPTESWQSSNYWVDIVFQDIPVAPVVCPCTVFKPGDTPEVPTLNDGQPIEIGFKFRTIENGSISGIRFYKGVGTTGTHSGHLWTDGGILLAEATFVNEGASGWQDVTFSKPVDVVAGRTYVASVHSSSGDFAYTNSYFLQRVENGPLIALEGNEEGGNGVYRYTPVPAFPVESYSPNNYWVDVVFNTNSIFQIIKQPVSQIVCLGTNVIFTVEAKGVPVPVIKWQSSINGVLWTDIPGANTGTLAFVASINDNGKLYRAILTSNGATITSSVATLTVNQVTASVFQKTNAGCSGGSLSITQTGGTSPYTYSLNGAKPQTSSNFTNLAAGNYTVTVKDAKGCTSTITGITISQTSTVSANILWKTNVSCGSNDGVLVVYGSGGTSPYSYSLNGTSYQTSYIFNKLAAGTYTVYVKDGKGCISTLSDVTLSQSSTLKASVTSKTNESCKGNDGSITVAASGGSGPYTYSLNGIYFQSSGTFNNLPADTYSVKVKDSKTCTVTVTGITISQVSNLTSSLASKTNESCKGDDGSITVTASGGTGPYLYSLNGINYQSSNTFSNLSAGTYNVKVKDSKTCTSTVSGISISQSSTLTSSLLSKTNASCSDNDGSITVVGSGGNSPYYYILSNGTYQSTGNFKNLQAGTYNVWVVDSKKCYSSINGITISEISTLSVGVSSKTNESCADNDGSITVSASGGKGPYQYSLNGGYYRTSNTFSNLGSGTYKVTVKDYVGCTSTLSGITVDFVPFTALVSSKTIVSCSGRDGSITLSATGGKLPLMYSVNWGNYFYDSDNTVSNLYPGTYTVRVRDARGCISTISNIAITQVAKLTVAVSSKTNACKNLDNASITVTGAGGIAPYQFSLNGATYKTSGVFTNLSPGTYSITVKDAKGCTSTVSGVSVSRTSSTCSNRSTYGGENVNIVSGQKSTKDVIEIPRVQVTPNPSNGNFNISLKGLNGLKVEIRLIDAVGREVLRKQLTVSSENTVVPINLQKVSKGMYFVNVLSEKETFSEKVIIQ